MPVEITTMHVCTLYWSETLAHFSLLWILMNNAKSNVFVERWANLSFWSRLVYKTLKTVWPGSHLIRPKIKINGPEDIPQICRVRPFTASVAARVARAKHTTKIITTPKFNVYFWNV